MSQDVKHRLPEFLGIGPPRTGTTWLHNVLEGHVDLPYGVKETLYFTTFYDKGFDWYARHFRYATGERKVAEVCPYFFDTVTLERIKAIMPNCKFIVTMRDPVDRLYSMYKALRYSAEARRGGFEHTFSVWPSMAKATVTRRISRDGATTSAARMCWSRCTTKCARTRSDTSIE